MAAVLVKTSGGVLQLVRVPVEEADSVGKLKARLAETLGLKTSSIEKVTLHGEELPDADRLCAAGVAVDVNAINGNGDAAAAAAPGADELLHPCGWFGAPVSAAAYFKVRDPTWPPARLAAYADSVRWLWLLLALLFALGALLP